MKNKKRIFILELNNGQPYEDYDKWVVGAFSDFEVAKETGKITMPSDSWYFNIVELEVDGALIKNHEIEIR